MAALGRNHDDLVLADEPGRSRPSRRRCLLSMRWHPTLEDDPAHRWFRQLLKVAAERIMQQPVS